MAANTVTYFGDVTTVGNTVVSQGLTSQGNYSIFTGNLNAADVIFPSIGSITNFISGIYISNANIGAILGLSSIYGAVGINTAPDSLGSIKIGGNVYSSNAISATNVFAAETVNVTDQVNTSAIYTPGGYLGINTTATGARLTVGGNIYASNAISTTNIFASGDANMVSLNTASVTGFVGINTTATGASLMVGGNIYASNAISATNVFVSEPINIFSIYTRSMSGFIGINTTATGASLMVGGNIYASNAISTTNIFASGDANMVSLNTASVSGFVGINTTETGARLMVGGNIYASNAISTTNVFVSQSINAYSLNTASVYGFSKFLFKPSYLPGTPGSLRDIGTLSGDGNTVVVESSVYTKNTDGSWMFACTLVNEGDQFLYLSISDDGGVILGVNYSDGFIYTIPDDGWSGLRSNSCRLQTDYGPIGAGTLSGDGNTAVIACYNNDYHPELRVFLKYNGWSGVQPITAQKTFTDDPAVLHSSVSKDGSTICLLLQDLPSQLYLRGGGWGGELTAAAYFSVDKPDQCPPAAFSSDGSVLAVGGYLGWVFTRPTNGWAGALSPTTSIVPPNPAGLNVSTITVSDDGKNIVIGTGGFTNYLLGVLGTPGFVKIYTRPSTGWYGTPSGLLLPTDDTPSFGGSVSISSDGGSIFTGFSVFTTTLLSSLGINTPAVGASLCITGNIYAPNAIFTTNLFVSRPINVVSMNTSSIYGASSSTIYPTSLPGDPPSGIGALSGDGNTAVVGSSVYIKNTGTWVFACYLNMAMPPQYISISDDGSIILATGNFDEPPMAAIYTRPVIGWAGDAQTPPPPTGWGPSVPSLLGNGEYLTPVTSISGDGNTIAMLATISGESGYVQELRVFLKPGGGWVGAQTKAAWETFTINESIVHLSMSKDGSTIFIINWVPTTPSKLYIKGSGWSGSLTAAAALAGNPRQPWSSSALSGDGSVLNVSSGSSYVFTKPASGWGGDILNQLYTLLDPPTVSDDATFIAMSDDGNTIVICYRDSGKVQIYKKDSSGIFKGSIIPTDGTGGWAQSVSISSDGGYIYSGFSVFNNIFLSSVGINTTAGTSGASLTVEGNIYASNTISATNLISYNANVTFLNTASICNNFKISYTIRTSLPGNSTSFYLPVNCLSGDGNTAVISNENGIVYTRNNDGSWTAACNLVQIGTDGFAYGLSISDDGSTIVATIRYYNGSIPEEAWIYTRPLGGWTGTVNHGATLDCRPGGGTGGGGGTSPCSISGDGETVVIAAGVPGGGGGQLFVFAKPIGGWVGTISSVANSPYEEDISPINVSLSKDGNTICYIIAGLSPGVRIYIKGAGWAGTLTPAATSDLYAPWCSVISRDGGTIVITGNNLLPPPATILYVFTKPAGGWAGPYTGSVAQLINTDITEFGYTLAISDDGSSIVAGSYQADPSGLVKVYMRPVDGWQDGSQVSGETLPTDGTPYFGRSVAMSSDGNSILAGFSVFSYYPFLPSVGINTTATGASLMVGGNIYASNAISVTNVFASGTMNVTGQVNTSAISTSTLGINTTAGTSGASLTVEGNIYASNTISATNLISYNANVTFLNTASICNNFKISSPSIRTSLPGNSTSFYLPVNCLSGDGNTAVISYENGIVYTRNNDGSWTAACNLVQIGTDGFAYGLSISDDGSTIVATIKYYNGSIPEEAWIYTRPLGGWTGTVNHGATLDCRPGGGTGGGGGTSPCSISGDGETVVIAAGVPGSWGQLFVFAKPIGGWVGTISSVANSPYEEDISPINVSLSKDGNTICYISSPGVRIYIKGAGGWAAALTPAATSDLSFPFCSIISRDGGTIVITCINLLPPPATILYVFTKPAGGWAGPYTGSVAQLINTDIDYFGLTLAISDDGSSIVAGSYQEDPSGLVKVYMRPVDGWQDGSQVSGETLPTDGTPYFGGSVAMSSDGNSILAGFSVFSYYPFFLPSVGINTTATGASLMVGGNIYASNAISVTNVFASGTMNVTGQVNTSAIYTPGGYLGINTTATGASLMVGGNIYASNAISTTNVFASGTIYYNEDITRQAPHLTPSVANASIIQNWIDTSCKTTQKVGWSVSAKPVYSNAVVGTVLVGATKYGGGVLLPDSRVVLIPRLATLYPAIYNPKLNTLTNYSIATLPGFTAGSGLGTFRGGVLAPNGNVIFFPFSTTLSIGILNPVNSTFSYVACPGVSSTNPFGSGCLIGSGNIILFPRQNANIGIFNPNTRTYSNSTYIGNTGNLGGGCLLPNGNVVMCNGASANIVQYNPVSTAYTNCGPIVNSTESAVLTPAGNVVLIPRLGPNVIVYNPSYVGNPLNPLAYSNIPVLGISTSTPGSFSGGCLLPTGNVILAPFSTSKNIGMVDPVAMTYSNCAESPTMCGAILLPSGQVVFPPSDAANVGVLNTFTPASIEFCNSPYFNKF